MTFCDHHWKIYPVLELTRHKPTEVELNLWIKEEIKAIFIPAGSIFTCTVLSLFISFFTSSIWHF